MPMEGAQEFNIPIDAPLEIESETTVVNAGSPTYLYNPMSKYNNLLGNAVKYEDEGWFIDWKRIQAKERMVGPAPTITPSPSFSVSSVFARIVSGTPVLSIGFDNGMSFNAAINGEMISGLDAYTREGNTLRLSFRYSDEDVLLILNANNFDVISFTPLPPSKNNIALNLYNNILTGSLSTKKVYDQTVKWQLPSLKYNDESFIPGDGESYELLVNGTSKFNGLISLNANGVISSLDSTKLTIDGDVHTFYGHVEGGYDIVPKQDTNDPTKYVVASFTNNKGLNLRIGYKIDIVNYTLNNIKNDVWVSEITNHNTKNDLSTFPNATISLWTRDYHLGEAYAKFSFDTQIKWIANPYYDIVPAGFELVEYPVGSGNYVSRWVDAHPLHDPTPLLVENPKWKDYLINNPDFDLNIFYPQPVNDVYEIDNPLYNPDFTIPNPDYKPMVLPDGTRNPDYDPSISPILRNSAYDERQKIWNDAYQPNPFVRNLAFDPREQVPNPAFDPDEPPNILNPKYQHPTLPYYEGWLKWVDTGSDDYDHIEVPAFFEIIINEDGDKSTVVNHYSAACNPVMITNPAFVLPIMLFNPDYSPSEYLYNEDYDLATVVKNEAYNPNQYIDNPEYDPTIPPFIWANPDDPDDTSIIPNPDYKSINIDNPDYDTVLCTDNPDYNDVLLVKNLNIDTRPLIPNPDHILVDQCIVNPNPQPTSWSPKVFCAYVYGNKKEYYTTGFLFWKEEKWRWAKTEIYFEYDFKTGIAKSRSMNCSIISTDPVNGIIEVAPIIPMQLGVTFYYEHLDKNDKYSFYKDIGANIATVGSVTKTWLYKVDDVKLTGYSVLGKVLSFSLTVTKSFYDDQYKLKTFPTDIQINLDAITRFMIKSISVYSVNINGTLLGLAPYKKDVSEVVVIHDCGAGDQFRAKEEATVYLSDGSIVQFVQTKASVPNNISDINSISFPTGFADLFDKRPTVFTITYGENAVWKYTGAYYNDGQSIGTVNIKNPVAQQADIQVALSFDTYHRMTLKEIKPLKILDQNNLDVKLLSCNGLSTINVSEPTLNPTTFVMSFAKDKWSSSSKNKLVSGTGDTSLIQAYYTHVFQCIPIGIFSANRAVGYVSASSGYDVKFIYGETEYMLHVPEESKIEYYWTSKDIRTKQVRTLHTFTEPEYTICQSHWCDSQEKDCWVVNEETMIVVHFNDEVSLWKKTKNTDGTYNPDIRQTYEWKQKKFYDAQGNETFKRFSDWGLGLRYGISSAIDKVPIIWALKWNENGLIVHYAEAPTETLDITFKECAVPITKRSFDIDTESYVSSEPGITYIYDSGSLKPDAAVDFLFIDYTEDDFNVSLNMLPPYFTPEETWNVCKITTTRKDDQLWMGIFIDKGMKQWVVKLTLDGVFTVINGFGYVGIDGTITGGMYPKYYVESNKGLVGKIFEYDSLLILNQYTSDGNDGYTNPKKYDKRLRSVFNKCFYDSNKLIFTAPFEELIYGITGSGEMIYMVANQTSVVQCSLGTQSEYDDKRDKGSFDVGGTLSPWIISAAVSLFAQAFLGAASSTWKIMNDISDSEDEFECKQSVTSTVDASNNILVFLGIAAAIAGAVVSTATTNNPIQNLGPSLEGALRDELSEQEEKSSKMTINTGQQRVVLKLSDFYSTGPQAKIHAGPGFVQIQMAKTSALNISGIGASRYLEEGIGIDLKQLIFIPGIIVGTANGPSSYFHPFGPPTPYSYSTGLLSATRLQLLGYRKYGYAHRYINYPTKDIETHLINDFNVQLDWDVDDLRPADGIDVKGQEITNNIYPSECVVEETKHELNDRVSIIQGSNLAATKMEKAKKSEQSNNNLTFSEPFVYDYCVYPQADLYITAVDSEIVNVSIKDTKVLDGEPSNIVIKNGNVYIGSSYCAIEVLAPSQFRLDNLRPRAVTPQTLLFNTTGYNCIHGDRIYHACDAYFNRVIKGSGAKGNDIEVQNTIYTYRADDDFKISSLPPAMSIFGKFSSAFSVKYDWLIEHKTPFYKSLKADVEVPETPRFSFPIVFNRLAILPAVGKTLAAYKFHVIEGVTGLVTDLRTTLPEARRPDSLDFPIYGQIYRWNPEYISSVVNEMGVQTIKDLVATIGLIYVGSTPNEAWFYSEAMRSFYKFQPTTVHRVMNADRYKEVKTGTFDFVAQEVVFDPVTPRGREIVRNSGEKFVGNIIFPNETIGPLDREDAFEFYSMAGGMVFQGLRRFQINRFLIMDYMVPEIKSNMGKWKRVQGAKISDFWKQRKYDWQFNFKAAPDDKKVVKEWFIEPFRIATSFLGIDDYSESKFQWLFNFALSDIMLEILGNRYITVYLAAETMTVGGVVESAVQRVRLHKTMFARQGQYGYYSYQYNANNGLGDSERLYMWTDGPILLRSLKMLAASKTNKRTSVMADYVDTQGMVEV